MDTGLLPTVSNTAPGACWVVSLRSHVLLHNGLCMHVVHAVVSHLVLSTATVHECGQSHGR